MNLARIAKYSRATDMQSVAQEYFASSNFLNHRILTDIATVEKAYDGKWEGMQEREKEKVVNDHIIYSAEAKLKQSQTEDAAPASRSYPRLRQRTGQKFVMEEEAGEQKPYRDEHSAPFGWKTRSQTNLAFDVYNSSSRGSSPEMSESGLEIVAARRSAILSCPFGQYSRMPRQAKKVLIPVVPQLNKPNKEQEEEEKDEEDALFGDDKTGEHENGGERVTLNGEAPKAEAEDANSDEEEELHVAPKSVDDLTSMVSSIVIATEENGIMLDFSEPVVQTDSSNSCSSSSETARSDTSLLSRVRDRTASMKRSLTPTLRRKRSVTSTDTLSTTATECDAASSTSSTPTKPSGLPRVSPNRILKPACPPPPPPSRPNAPPPPPPPSTQNCQSDSNQDVQKKVSDAPAPKQAPARGRVPPPAPPARAPTTKISASIENILVVDSQTVFKGSGDSKVTNIEAKPKEIPS